MGRLRTVGALVHPESTEAGAAVETKCPCLLRLHWQDEYSTWIEPCAGLGVTGSTMPVE
jgi:hypothetical protein